MARTRLRDDFTLAVKQKLAARAGHACSNPECRAATSGPKLLEDQAVNVGVACHLSGAASGGPRYDVSLTHAQRAAINNGIWLCQTCSKLIDSDEQRYTMGLLLQWKTLAEQEAHRRIGKTKSIKQPSSAERELKRDLKLRDQIRKDFLKPWQDVQRERQSAGGPVFIHPYEKFRYSKVVIHRIGDDVYPEIDDRPGIGISSWFRVELYDFYYASKTAIPGTESGQSLHTGPISIKNGSGELTSGT